MKLYGCYSIVEFFIMFEFCSNSGFADNFEQSTAKVISKNVFKHNQMNWGKACNKIPTHECHYVKTE